MSTPESRANNTAPPRQDLHVQLTVSAFRAFRDDVTVDLRPLTLLYGQNQAGKSSLLRLVSLISDSLRPNVPALDLASPALRGASFKDLGWLGKDPIFTPRITIAAPDAPQHPRITLGYGDDSGLLVDSLRMGRDEQERYFDVRMSGRTTRGADHISAQYAGDFNGQDWSGPLSFRRFFPEGLPADVAATVRDLDHALATLQRVRWLHANRLADGVGRAIDGSPSASLLREPRYQVVLEKASQWLRDQGKLGDEIAIRPDSEGQPRFVLGFTGRERLPLHLAGEGVRALLPVILSACWAEFGQETQDGNAPSLLAIEEPETNLHPHLHVALFDRLLETVRAGVPVILETHSVYLLRAMQLAVLKKRILPEQIGLHWVEQGKDGVATVTRVDVEADASLKQWQPNAFEKEQELAHEIFEERWKLLGGT